MHQEGNTLYYAHSATYENFPDGELFDLLCYYSIDVTNRPSSNVKYIMSFIDGDTNSAHCNLQSAHHGDLHDFRSIEEAMLKIVFP